MLKYELGLQNVRKQDNCLDSDASKGFHTAMAQLICYSARNKDPKLACCFLKLG